jgi:hypothetical protein
MYLLYQQVVELNSMAKKHKRRADAALEKVQTAEQEAVDARAELANLKKDLEEFQQLSDRRLEKVKAEHVAALEAARAEGHAAGFNEAGEAYAADIFELVEAGKVKGFGKGYLYALDAMEVPADDPKREIPEMPSSPQSEEAADPEDGAEDEEERPAEETPHSDNLDNQTANLSS